MDLREIRLCEMRKRVLFKQFWIWEMSLSELLQGRKGVSMDQPVLEDYPNKIVNRYNLDCAIEEIHKIARRINDLNYERSLGLILGLIAEETLPHVLNNTLESMLFKFRYFYWVDKK